MKRSILFAFSLVVTCLGMARADTIVNFQVTIDTSSMLGDAGGIYLNFSPGFLSDPAAVSILNFEPTAGLPGTSCFSATPCFTDGGVSGYLDTNNLAMTNYTSALNDYGESLTFGNTVSFIASFDLPGILTGSSGSELDIQLTEADLLTPVLTPDPSGNIVEISYDQNGNFNATSTSSFATVTELSSAPEPAMTGLLLALGCGVGVWRRRSALIAAC